MACGFNSSPKAGWRKRSWISEEKPPRLPRNGAASWPFPAYPHQRGVAHVGCDGNNSAVEEGIGFCWRLRSLTVMHSLMAFLLIVVMAAHGGAGWAASCLCMVPREAVTCCPSQQVAELPTGCCCSPERAAGGQTFFCGCDCSKQAPPALLQIVRKEVRRPPDSPWTLPHATWLEADFQLAQLLASACAISVPIRSFQKLFCVWRE